MGKETRHPYITSNQRSNNNRGKKEKVMLQPSDFSEPVSMPIVPAITLLRGLPGSGKSTWIKNTFKLGPQRVCSADDYHITANGAYRYDPKNAGAAHSVCLRKYVSYILQMVDGVGRDIPIVVDNTNTTLVELAPYVRLAEAFNLNYEIVYFVCSLETSVQRNTHQVPIPTLLKMQANLLTEIVPSHWNQRVILLQEDSVPFPIPKKSN